MSVPQYISTEEVRKICKDIGIRDWTKLKSPHATRSEARSILRLVNREKMPIDVEEFRAGLDVELEHGTRFSDANVTSNHPLVTGKIVLAHMKESLDYYKLLEVAELEGDVLAAVAAGNAVRTKAKYRKLAAAKIVLQQAVLKRLGK
jgi:hypothetical protein